MTRLPGLESPGYNSAVAPRLARFSLLPLGPPVSCERPQAGEAEGRVDVVFDDIEGEVVEAAEGPDCDAEQYEQFQGRLVGDD